MIRKNEIEESRTVAALRVLPRCRFHGLMGFEATQEPRPDAAKTSFACHLFLKAIYDIFGTHLH
jgi:hypothetical protein